MSSIARRVRFIRWRAVIALAPAWVAVHAVAAGAQQNTESFVRWATAHAVPIQSVEPGTGFDDLRRLQPIIGNARIVALGEPTHGAHEPLAFRNRLFQYLVEELGFTAIAIESGLAESRRIFDFVAGGPGADGPDAARKVVRENLTWGFGSFEENEELARWIRAYNADTTHRRKVRFYGFDQSLGGAEGSTPTPDALEAALSFVERADVAAGGRWRAALRRYLGAISGGGRDSLSPTQHDSARAAIDGLISLLERERTAFIARTSELEYEWAHRSALVARQADRVSSLFPPAPPGGGLPPAAWRGMTARDSGMAENVRWVLDREGPEGRVLVFAHNAHVKNAPTEGGIWDAFERPPRALGEYLRSALGDELRIIGMSSAAKPTGLLAPSSGSGSIDAALERVGRPRFLLDLRAAHADSAAAGWLSERRTLRANLTTQLMLSPGAAFDVLVYVDTLTLARPAKPPG